MAARRALLRGTQFTCFASTRVQILTPEELHVLAAASGDARSKAAERAGKSGRQQRDSSAEAGERSSPAAPTVVIRLLEDVIFFHLRRQESPPDI
jgi:hypothetical protein